MNLIQSTLGVRLLNCAFKFHAADEERAMFLSKYPYRDTHKIEHKRIVMLLDGMEVHNAEVTKQEITRRITDHIEEYDKPFQKYLEGL